MDYILAIDSGTTSTRVLAFDTMGRVECVEQIGLDTIFPQPGWVEQNPMEIWEKTNECLTTVLKTIGSNNVNSIGLTNQRETSIIWQRSTGKAIGPAINWQCRRTQLSCEKRSGFTQKK